MPTRDLSKIRRHRRTPPGIEYTTIWPLANSKEGDEMPDSTMKLRELRSSLNSVRKVFEQEPETQPPLAPTKELLLDPEIEKQFGEVLAGVLAQLIAQGDLPEEILEDPNKLKAALRALLRDLASKTGIITMAIRLLTRRGPEREIRLVRRQLAKL